MYTALTPMPLDALIAPVTFRVRRRRLKGILAEFDALEDGSRELAGEWITAKPLGKPMATTSDKVILYIHGGAYYLFGPATHRNITIPLSREADAHIFGN
jgi:acetyl esterase/lipase